MKLNKIYNIDCLEGLKQLADESIDTCVTSPPYWGLRDYGAAGQLGLENTFDEYLLKMVEVFREVKRVLKAEGTLWLNLGDSYAGSGKGVWKNPKNVKNNYIPENKHSGSIDLKPKNLIGIPWRVAFALQEDGWYLRSDIIWDKPNAMPESVTDRPTRSHEYIFLLSKNPKYYYDSEAIKEPCVNGDPNPPRGSIGASGPLQQGRRKGNGKTFRGSGVYTQGQSFNNSNNIAADSKGNEPNLLQTRNKRTVWTVATAQFKESHFATFPPKLIEPCILASCPVGGVVLDPFMGSGTTAEVALTLQRNFIGFEINQEYIDIAEKNRLSSIQQRMI